MQTKKLSFKAVFAVLILVGLLAVVMPTGKVSAATITVGPTGTYSTIQAAIAAATAGDIITVEAGVYTENVNVNKGVVIIGAGAGTTSIVATDANKTPLTFSSTGASVSGFTITHAYTPTELSDWNFNNNGVSFTTGGNTLENCTVSLNRNGIYLRTQNNIIDNNVITNNRTGINATATIDGTQIINNSISDNWTLGFIYYRLSSATDFATVTITDNTFDNNWYSEILIKDASDSHGELDVNSNIFTDDPVTYSISADSSLNEPAFADQKPVALGGTATKPVEDLPTLRIYNSSLASIAYTGKTLEVCPIVPNFLTIQSAIDAASDGDTILVCPGTYNETAPLTINKPNLTVQSTSGAATTVINVTGSGLYNGVEVLKNLGDVTFEGFTVQNFTQDGIKQSYTQKQGTAFHVLNNIVIPQDDYLRNGIEVTGDGSTVIGNTVFGKLLTADWGSCGIQVDDASNVIVEDNIIDGDPLVDYGICVAAWDYDIEDVLIQGNTISNADTAIGLVTGIYTPQTISNVSILSNHLSDSSLGIGAFSSEYNSSILTLTLGGTIKLEGNQFDGIVDNDFVVGDDVVGASGLVIDASPNWWGQITGPENADILAEGTSIPESSIAFTPWCGDPDCTFFVPDENGVIELSGNINIPGGIVVNQPNLTFLIKDGTVIQNDSPCFIVNADYTKILGESYAGGKCIPTNGSAGIVVADGITDFILDGIEIDGTGQTTGSGVLFAGDITDVQILNNFIHDLDGDGVTFTNQPAATPRVLDIQGNLFKHNAGVGVNNAGTTDINAEYNSWSDVAGPSGTDGDGATNADTDPFTHVDLYMVSTNPDVDFWANQVFVGEEITYQIKAHMVDMTTAAFKLTYPTDLLGSPTIDNVNSQFFPVPTKTDIVTVDSVNGVISFDGQVSVGTVLGDVVLFEVTFTGVLPGEASLNFDEDTDLFGMSPGYGPSLNIYADELLDGTLKIITRPTLDIVGLEGPFVAGISHIITSSTCNAATGGDWTESVAAPIEPDTIGWIRISDITIAEIASIQFLWGGNWYDFDVQDAVGGTAVQQDGDDVIARFGNYDFGLEIPVDQCDFDAFRITFLNPGVHDVTVELYDMMDTPFDGIDPEDILLTSFGPVAISIDGDFTVTGTVSMQGRTNRAGVPMRLTKSGLPEYGPFNATSIDVLSNNITFTGVNGGLYTITTNMPRYLNVTADLGKTIGVNGPRSIAALELKGGNAVWSDNVINTGDASRVGTYYGQTIDDDADVNYSGKVDIFDLALVGGNFDLTSEIVYADWSLPEFNGTVEGIIDDTGGVISGEVSGDYNLVFSGTPTGGDGITFVTFEGTVSGDINGTFTGTLKFMGLDSLYAIFTGTGAVEPVRLYGNFLQSGIDGHFAGTIVTGPELDPITSMSISGGETVVAGQTLQLNAITDPAGRDVLWTVYVNDRAFGTIDMGTGLLTGLQPGTVTVIAVAVDDSNLSYATKVITVTAP